MQSNASIQQILALANALKLLQIQKARANAPESAQRPFAHSAQRPDVDSDDDQDIETEEQEASYHEPLPLLVNSSCPSIMRRDKWSLSDYAFKTHDRIEGGAVSEVYKAACRISGQPVVVKVTDLDGDYCSEALIHTNLHHEHIIECHASWQETSEDGIEQLVMVIALADAGDLSSLLRDQERHPLGRMVEGEAVGLVILPLLKALGHIHARGIVHRDIKLENILFVSDKSSEGRSGQPLILKLCDFGVSKQLVKGEGGNAFTPGCGTMAFIAREVFEVGPDGYGTSADIWSMGVLTFKILTGSSLFEGQGDALRSNIVEGKRAEFPSWTSPLGRSFISDAIHDDPDERPDAFELMRHPWIKANQVKDSEEKSRSKIEDEMTESLRCLRIVI